MERNNIMILNNILYHLHDSDNFLLTRTNLLRQLQMLIPFSYSSILLSDLAIPPSFTDPVCYPESFLPIEKKYIKMAKKDHTLWTMEAGYSMVVCESRMLPDHKRLATPIYQECYSQCNIYDSLQLNIAYNNSFLGVLTLYRTKQEGTFHDEDIFLLNLIGQHLNRIFHRAMVAKKDSHTTQPELLRDLYGLTNRETEILALLLQGLPEASISEQLNIAASTLKKHIQHIYRKLDISSRWELLRLK